MLATTYKVIWLWRTNPTRRQALIDTEYDHVIVVRLDWIIVLGK